MHSRQEDLRRAQSRCTTFIIDADKYPLHDVGCVFQCVSVYFWVATGLSVVLNVVIPVCVCVCVCLNNEKK